MTKQQLTYTLSRLPIGFSFLGHGFIRIPKINAFETTMHPVGLVDSFALALLFIELLLGLALIFGIKMKQLL